MSAESRYRQIAAEIRARITNGELQPGDRVPSTRRITQQWGVAMATATKVIAALREEGLVETRSGAGTVVRSRGLARPARAVSPREPDLGRERIVRAAMTIADAEGIGALSMRRVATDLDVATMSLYRHVSAKEELTTLMADAAFGEVRFPARPPREWRARLHVGARLMWTVFRGHPWAAEVMSMTRPQLMPNLLAYAEWTLSPLRQLGLDVDTMMHIHLTLVGHVRGTALNLQSEAQAQQDTGMTADEWIETQEPELAALLASGHYPTLEYVVRHEFDYDLDALFDFGLHRLLDGFDILLRRRGARPG